ncbi:hypothetical protein NE237_028724 [Protea cynaroides]|uniref:Uncharacterized protein n=1 Tax=Protea cynaroides TaxID=273540 RepID=A0A9Q0GPV9_9MAGN|nr:hypothetical protein NE237_028724 [Protea cynaroides]
MRVTSSIFLPMEVPDLGRAYNDPSKNRRDAIAIISFLKREENDVSCPVKRVSADSLKELSALLVEVGTIQVQGCMNFSSQVSVRERLHLKGFVFPGMLISSRKD